MKYIGYPYTQFAHVDQMPREFLLVDHLDGFDQNFNNPLLSKLQRYASDNNLTYKIHSPQVFDNNVTQCYPNLDIVFDLAVHESCNLSHLHGYREHPKINYKNFICSFNGTGHVSRKLLASILHRFGYFNTGYCSKNFSFTVDSLDGNIRDYVGDRDKFYRKFFIADDSEEFFENIESFGHVRYNHARNIHNLESKITGSFLHIISETLATSYVPFITEKFLYSIATRGLFLAYGQLNWHAHLEKYYGFKKYDTIFDYHFDSVQNPVERVVELMTMVSKFSRMSKHDWHDLYLLEADTIDFNYDWYFSKKYLKQLEKISV